jgi:dienelactone hydrolase
VAVNSFQRQVQDRLLTRVRQIGAGRARRLAALRTPAQVHAYQQQVRAYIAGAFAPLPERTPLAVQTTGTLAGDGFRVEKLLFYSRPGCPVTGNLYLPAPLTGRVPGVLVPCGHSHNGKAHGLYQQVCMRLARNGLAALIYDPFNQGERDQYHGQADHDLVKYCTMAHNMMGKQLELVGEWFGTWRLWDAMRALDVLAARPEVDPERLGATGNSGGGTMTSWLWATEPRLKVAAPSCFTTTELVNLENELPADAEQYPPGLLGAGYERVDLLLAQAPKPLLLLGQQYDFFDQRGFWRVHGELAAIYDQLGARDRLGAHMDQQGHGFSPANQLAAVRWLRQWLDVTGPLREDAPEPFAEAAVQVTPTGQVLDLPGTIPIQAQIAAIAAAHRAQWRPLRPAALRRRLRALLTLPPRRGVPHYRVLRAVPGQAEGSVIARYAIETEPGICAVLRRPVTVPEHGADLTCPAELALYLPHLATEPEAAAEPLAADAWGLDVRGLGESLPDLLPGESFWDSYGKDYFHHGFHLMLGESCLGRRVHDVLRTLDLLTARGLTRCHLRGHGQGALLALFAGVLHPAVATLTLRHLPASCTSWVATPLETWPAAMHLRGLLREFDLPECLAACPGQVTLLDPATTRRPGE